MRKTDPLPGWEKIVYWDQRTAPVPSGGIDEMRGIQLDRDWVSAPQKQRTLYRKSLRRVKFMLDRDWVSLPDALDPNFTNQVSGPEFEGVT